MMYNSYYIGDPASKGEWDDGRPSNKPYICRFVDGGDYADADSTAEITE